MKKNWLRLLCLTLAVLMVALPMAGCKTSKKDYDFYIFNTKGENADALQAAVNAYQTETGQKVKVFSLGSGTDSTETLRAEMNSTAMPTIFSIMNSQELIQWIEGGFALDLSKATYADFVTLHNNVAKNLRLTTNGTDSYGIPYNVEGYGYIVDKDMLADLFGSGNVNAFIADFKTATYSEFESLVLAVDAYIKNGTAGTVTLSGHTYTFASTKGTLSSKLTGVFATAGSQTWTYGDHMINIAIDTHFANSAATQNATDAQIDAMRTALIAYAKALDLKTSHAAGMDGPLARGADFINTTTAGYDAEIEIFASHKALFVKQGNWVYTNLQTANPDIVDTLTFLPIKMPFTSSDITVSGLTVDAMNSSIPVFVPNYYAINAKATKEEQEKAEQFLVWLNTSKAGQKFVIEDMAFIPYNADPAKTTVPNSLGQSILEYLSAGKTLTNAYAGAPTGWTGKTVGQKIMESYLTKATWTTADYEAIADYAISTWKSMK